jgi:hypothetical protein
MSYRADIAGPTDGTRGSPMKSLTRYLFLCLWACLAPASLAQVPTVALYSDVALQERDIEACPLDGPGVVGRLYVVAEDFDMAMASIEYRVDLSQYLLFLADVVPTGVVEGNSIDGIRITYPTPADATGRLLVETIVFEYWCEGCMDIDRGPVLNALSTVLPHPESGKIQAFRSPDLVAVEAEGLTSILCELISIPVDGGTWGMIKALYR